MIKADQLCRKFGETYAVQNLSFHVRKGEVMGLLGPNGAGKSTTMKMLTCFLPPSSGEASIDSVSLQGPHGQSIMDLRGLKKVHQSKPQEKLPPASEVSREYQYIGLMSEISSDDAKPGESQAAADTRIMNRVFGLADQARITAIDRVEVATAAEARAELQQRLTSSDPIRISVQGDALEVLYVTPN